MISVSADVEPGTRTPFTIDGAREIPCLVKGNETIAAQRCAEEQEGGCFCPAAFGALQGVSAICAETDKSNEDDGRRAQRQKWRISLVALKARAAGFAGKKQEFAGPALSHMNRELQRRKAEPDARTRAVQLRQPAEESPRNISAQVCAAPPPSAESPSGKPPAITPNPARGTVEPLVEEGTVLSALVNLGYTRKTAVAAVRAALRAVGVVDFTAIFKEALRVIREGPTSEPAAAVPTPAAAARRVRTGERCARCGCRLRSDGPPGDTCGRCTRRPGSRQKSVAQSAATISTAAEALAPPVTEAVSPVTPTITESVTDVDIAFKSWRAQGLELRKVLEAEQWHLLSRLDEVKKALATLPK